MNASHPLNSEQDESPAATPSDAVLSESLRDTTAAVGHKPEGGGLKFSFASGSRPLEGYTLKRGVGRGGFGEVYFATSDAGKEVALKCIRRNLEIELRGVSQCLNLKHTNLVSLFDIRQDEQENFWVVMEFVSGESLDQIIASHPSGLPTDRLLNCIRQIGAGVAYLHDRGIVHRDLKPGNIFLDEGTFKIGDYGLSKFISSSRRSGQTESIGTVHYMAPEIANGRYGKEIDIYALGIIFYEMLTGHVPYDGESLGEVLMKHLTAEPDLTGIAEPYRSIVARLLHKNPELRYPSVQSMLSDLDAGLAGQPLSAQPFIAAAGEGVRERGSEGASERVREEASGGQQRSSPRAPPPPRSKRLTTSSGDAVAQGVCGGFAKYFGIDPLWIRLVVFITAFFTGFVAVGAVYMLLAWLMPSDEEEVPTLEDLEEESAPGTPIDMLPFFRGLGRLALALILGLSVGLLTGGLAKSVLPATYGYDAGVLAGIASGLLVAAVAGWLWLGSSTSSFPKVINSLLLGGAFGVAAALTVFLTGGFDYMAGFVGTGIGFLTAGVAACVSLSFSRVIWRVLPPLFFGLAAGLLTGAAGISVLGLYHDAPAAIGFGAGLLVCASTAWLLFMGPLAVIGSAHGGDATFDAAKASSGDGATGSVIDAATDSPYTMPMAVRILIGLAVVLGTVPFTLHWLVPDVRPSTPHQSTDSQRQSGQTRCDRTNCSQAATTMLQVESFTSKGAIETNHWCEEHASKRILQAKEAGMKYNRINLSE